MSYSGYSNCEQNLVIIIKKIEKGYKAKFLIIR